jgi:hypothetical protein
MTDEPKMPSGLDAFTRVDDRAREEKPADFSDAESFFNLPQDDDDEDDEIL